MNIAALEWIPKALSPNARPHYMAKHKAVRAYRAMAYYRGAGGKRLQNPFCAVLPIVTTRRRRDLDNVLAGLKSAFDGFSDAGWWSDDSAIKGFHLVPEQYCPQLVSHLIIVLADEDERQNEIAQAVAVLRGACETSNLWAAIGKYQREQ